VLLMLGLVLVASRAGGRQIRLLSYAGIALLTFTIFLTQSRGAFLGLMVGALLSIATQRKRLRILLGIGVLAALIVVAAPPAVWARLGGLTKLTSTETISEADQEGSAKGRYAIWHVALRISEDNPFSGVGFGSYPLVHEDYANRTPGAPISILGRRDTHSTYLNALAETGIFGMLAILGFVIHFGVFLARTTKRLSTLAPRRAEQFKYLLSAWIAFWVAGLFGSFHRIVFPYLFVGFATALAAQYGVLGRSAAPAPAPARGESAGRVPLFRAARSS
jgi:O-antigen ligase